MLGNILFGSTPFGGVLGKELGFQKILRYTIVGEVERKVVQKPLQYRIVAVKYEDKYQSKESEYVEKHQSQESEYADKYVSKGTKYRQRY